MSKFRDAVLDVLRKWDGGHSGDLADAIAKLHDDAVGEAVKPWREALIGCAMNDRTPLYEYPGNCRTKKQVEECRDQCGYLPRRGSRWQTPEEIARDMLGADFDKMITAECHTRALLAADKPGKE